MVSPRPPRLLAENANARLPPTPEEKPAHASQTRELATGAPKISPSSENTQRRASHKRSTLTNTRPTASSSYGSPAAREVLDEDSPHVHSTSEHSTGARASTYAIANEDTTPKTVAKPKKGLSNVAKQQIRVQSAVAKCNFEPVKDDQQFRAQLADIESLERLFQHYDPIYHPQQPAWYDNIVDEAFVLNKSGPLSKGPIRGSRYLELEDVSLSYRPAHTGSTVAWQASLDGVLSSPRNFDLSGRVPDKGCRIDRAPIIEAIVMFPEANLNSIGKPHLYIRTEGSKKRRIWYELKSSNSAYQALWDDSMWLIDLSTYVFQYCFIKGERQVAFQSLKADFSNVLTQRLHGDQLSHFNGFLQRSAATDLRQHVARHASILQFVRKTVPLSAVWRPRIENQPIWTEMGLPPPKPSRPKARPSTRAPHDNDKMAATPSAQVETAEQPEQDAPVDSKTSEIEKSVVTPNVASLYRKATAATSSAGYDLLEVVSPSPEALEVIEARQKELGLPSKLAYPQTSHFKVNNYNEAIPRTTFIRLEVVTANDLPKFSVEDVLDRLVIILQEYVKGKKKRIRHRYAYVRGEASQAQKVLVIWMISWDETCFSDAVYPIGNELWFSDECCKKCVANVTDIVKICEIALFQDHAEAPDGLFARSTYRRKKQTFEDIHPDQVLHKCLRCELTEREIKPSCQPPSLLALKLRHNSIFSGCVGLDYAMTEAGTIETRFAIDIDAQAMLSHAANDDGSHICKRVTGSVCPPLKNHLLGKELLPKADVISGGPPCRGFSAANNSQDSEESAKYRTLLATAVSWVEANPSAYVLFENVAGVGSKSNEDQARTEAGSQVIAALQMLGYQCGRQLVKVDTLENGFTSRARVIFSAAAPGLKLPWITASENKPEPGAIWEILKNMRGGPICNTTTLNPANPDHVPLGSYKIDMDRRFNPLDLVSKMVPGKSLFKMKEEGLLDKSEKLFFDTLTEPQRGKFSRTLGRNDPTKPFRTITTKFSWLSYQAKNVHAEEDRAMTLEELRLVMGYPETFIIFGAPRRVLHQIGNSVPWALGKAMQKAVDESRAEADGRRREALKRPYEPEIGGSDKENEKPDAKKRWLA